MITEVSQSSALGEAVVEQDRRPGVDLLNLAHEEAGDVEVVHRHVQERAAAGQQELEGRRVGVAGERAELLDAAQGARVDQLLRPDVAGIEAAHEPHLDGEPGLAPQVDDLRRVRQLLRDRLLGPDGLAGSQGGLDVRGVRRRRGVDDDGLDIGVVDGVERVGGRATRAREDAAGLGRIGVRVGDHDHVGVRDRAQVADVDPAHAAGAEHRDADVVGVPEGEAGHRVAPPG